MVNAQGRPPRIISLPPLKALPSSTIKHLETLPEYADTLRKFPELARRQRQLDDSAPYQKAPLYQMFECWIEKQYDKDYYEMNAEGEVDKSRLGTLTLEPHGMPPMGVLIPNYKQPEADLVKPVLFCIEGRFYSVYGDCQVAGHVPIKGYPDDLAALRYAGNSLYACSKELSPPLQSCGVGKDGVIWLADLEGHVAFFRTKSTDFIRSCTAIAGAVRLLIPRDNRTDSVFAFDTEKKVFREYQVAIGEKVVVTPATLTLPSDAGQVLYSDAEQVVFLAADRVVVQPRKVGEKERALSLGLGKNEKVWEGLCLPKTKEVAMLVGPALQLSEKLPEYSKLSETNKSWDNMRLHVVKLLADK